MQISIAQKVLQIAEKITDKMARYLAGLKDSGEHQIVLFEFCGIVAEVTAAQAALKSLSENSGKKTSELEVGLTHLFIAEAFHSLCDVAYKRLDEYGLTMSDMEVAFADTDVAQFVREGLSSKKIEQVADVLIQDQPDGASHWLGDQHQIFCETFRKYAEAEVKPLAEKIHRGDLLIPEKIIKELSAMGCFGLSLPQKYGGFQDDDKPDHTGLVVVTEELARGSLGIAGSLITRPEILAKALLKGGTEEQKQKWLPEMATGAKMVAIAVTEPDHGSDVAGMKLAATRTKGGWLLHGCKTWCTFAGYADVLLVLARTDPDLKLKHKGLSIFIVEKPRFTGHDFEHKQKTGGKISGRAIGTIGYRGMHSFECFFDNYFVPDDNLVGGEKGLGQGFYLQMEGFAGGRLQTAGRALGVMQAAFEEAMKYARDRVVFGKPVSEYQLTKFKLVRMASLIHVIRQFTYSVARLMDEGQGVLESSMVKVYASRTSEWVTREAMQIHGGMGYAEEFPVSRYFVDARVFSIFEGAEETLVLKVIARQLLERALS